MDALLLAPGPAPEAVTDCSADTSGDPYEALAWKVGGLFGILITSCIGVALPYFMRGERHRNTIFFLRAFAAGVVLSVAFVHILPEALEMFANPCLVMPADIPWASIIAVCSALLCFMVEYYVREGLLRQSSKNAAAAKGEQLYPGALDCKDCVAECADCTVDCTADCTTGVAGADCQECQTAALDCQECQVGSSPPGAVPAAAAEITSGLQGPLSASMPRQVGAGAGPSPPQPTLSFPPVTSGAVAAGAVAPSGETASAMSVGPAPAGLAPLPAGVVMTPVAPSQKLPPPCPSDCVDCCVQMACCLGPAEGKKGFFSRGTEGATKVTALGGNSAEQEPALGKGGVSMKEGRYMVTPEQLQVHTATAFSLEAGIVFHSIFIGIALGTSRDVTNVQGLVIALVFHQGFEGIALGGAYLKARFSVLRATILGLIFACTCPLGVAIGLGVAQTYNANNSQVVAVEAAFNSISAGILIFNGLVDLLLPTFDHKDVETPTNPLVVAFGFVFTFIGVGAMSTLALWA